MMLQNLWCHIEHKMRKVWESSSFLFQNCPALLFDYNNGITNENVKLPKYESYCGDFNKSISTYMYKA